MMLHNSHASRLPTPHCSTYEQTVGYVVGVVLVASGAFHLLVWAVDGGYWAGPVSWRKPILFGFSTGVTALSLTWVHSKLPSRRGHWRTWGDQLVMSLFHLALLAEVTLITVQQWRGVPSHFNQSTVFDARVLLGIETLIIFIAIIITQLTYRSFSQRLVVTSDMALAIRGGMALLSFACLLGFVLVAYGNAQIERGADPGQFGARGVMKFPHGVPIHAIQFLPLLSGLMLKLGVSGVQRQQTILWATFAIISFTAFSLVQTFTGHARLELNTLSAPLLVLSFICVAFAGSWTFRRGAVRKPN